MNKSKYILILFTVLITQNSFGQSIIESTESWFQTFVNVRLSNDWGVATDIGHRRRVDFHREYFQGLGRVGLVRYFGQNTLTAGYALFETNGNIEHRSYQFLVLPQSLGLFNIRHRYRFEQRWRKQQNENVFDFNYRFGYQIVVQIPLIGNEIKPKVPFLLFQDELFLNFGGNMIKNNLFDQNRILVGIGYQFSSVLAVNAGFQYNFVQRPSAETFEEIHSIRINLIANIDLRKPKIEMKKP